MKMAPAELEAAVIYQIGALAGMAAAEGGRLTHVKPHGALYMFPRLDPKVYPIQDDQEFAYELLEEEKVLIVQGSGFNWPGTDHFRVVFLPHTDDLTEAFGRIERFLAHYRRRLAN